MPRLHPRRRAHVYGVDASEFLPSSLTYTGEESEEHREDYARFCAFVAENRWGNNDARGVGGFSAAFSLVGSNGYKITSADVPDNPPGAKAAFIRWVKENVSPNQAYGLAGSDWWA